VSHQKKLITESPKLVRALVAACDLVPEATADPMTLDCMLTLRYASDDERVENAVAAYQDGSLSVNVREYERAERAVADCLREAKRNAQDAALGPDAAALVRQGVSPGIATRRIAMRDAERREMEFKLNHAARAQRRGLLPPQSDNGTDGEGEG